MKINVSKENEDITLSLFINGKNEPFNYVSLVNELYKKKEIEEINYSEKIKSREKEEINKLIQKIVIAIKEPEE